MSIFGAKGIRDAMTKSYGKHVRIFREHPLPEGTSVHEAALYAALATRYMAASKPLPEVVVWTELAPFTNLPPDEGLAALAEYVVYKEMPAKANKGPLLAQIRRGWSLVDENNRESVRMMAEANGIAWVWLI